MALVDAASQTQVPVLLLTHTAWKPKLRLWIAWAAHPLKAHRVRENPCPKEISVSTGNRECWKQQCK